jgi:hypothetical protein
MARRSPVGAKIVESKGALRARLTEQNPGSVGILAMAETVWVLERSLNSAL